MNARWMVALGILIGVLMSSVAPAAQAAPSVDVAEVADVAAASTPSGRELFAEPWTAPYFPVHCLESAAQVSCTPESPADSVAQKCFLRVILTNGERATVCTTYEAHTHAIQAAGGKEGIIQFGCSLGDGVCGMFENAGRGMAAGTTAAMFAVAETMRFDTSTALWSAAVGEWSFWRWAVLAVMFAAMVWAIAAAIVSGERDQLVSAIIRSFLAFPATAATLWLTGHVLNAIDDLTWYVMNRDGPAVLFRTLQQVMWAGGKANYFFGFVIIGLLLIAMVLLMLVFAFRNIALAALIMVGPLAWMLFPVRSIGPQWIVRYLSAVVVLLLTGPLTIGFVTLIINGLASLDTIWNPQAWPLLAGLIFVAFAPFAVFGLFSFIGAVAADAGGSSVGSRAGHAASTVARKAMSVPARINAHPAGRAPSNPRGPRSSTRSSVSGVKRPSGTTETSSATSSRSSTSSGSTTATSPGSTTTGPKTANASAPTNARPGQNPRPSGGPQSAPAPSRPDRRTS